MYILFHGVVFDPAELISAEARDEGVMIQLCGGTQPTLITSESQAPMAMLGELYQFMLEQGIAYQPEDGPEIELDEDELAELTQLSEDGYEWIARDKSGAIFAYRFKPIKKKATYEDPRTPEPIRLEEDWYSEIDFDAGPISINYLILDG